MLLDTNIVSAFLTRDAQKRTPKLFDFVTTLLSAEGRVRAQADRVDATIHEERGEVRKVRR
jgi:hypothetical protein